MEENHHRIGSWNGLILMSEFGGASQSAHRHEFHMLRLQSRGTTITMGQMLGETLGNAIALHLIGNYSSAPTAMGHKGGTSGPRLRRIVDYVENHMDEDLSLTPLAAEAAMSMFHFSRAFRQSTGLSPYQYVLHRRIEQAKKLLRKSDLTVGEISFRTGFIQQNHFSRLFQKKTGFTPTAFRRQLF